MSDARARPDKSGPIAQLQMLGKMVVLRVRHRPALVLAAGGAAFCLLLVARGSPMGGLPGPPGLLHAGRPPPSPAAPACGQGPPSLWPWSFLGQHGAEARGEDPADTYPLFRELETVPDPLYEEFVSWHGDDYEAPPKPPYKDGHTPAQRHKKLEQVQEGAREAPIPIPDPFPLLSQRDAATLRSSGLLPQPRTTRTRTPLLIGFTRNWPLLLQCVTSYLAAGWPARDIYVVENTGTMGANRAGRLTLQNPFFLNHTQLADLLGVHVLETPTLFTFAQLQNFYLYTAQQMGWATYFWSHQDVVVFSEEGYGAAGDAGDAADAADPGDGGTGPRGAFFDTKRSLHHRALATLKILTRRDAAAGGSDDDDSAAAPPWATHFFDYDRLTLVNVAAYMAVGAWDTHIAFYATDCDMYLRLKWAGYWQGMLLPAIGRIFDVAGVLDDLAVLVGAPGVRAAVGGWGAPGVNDRLREERLDARTAVEDVEDVVYVVEQMRRAKNDAADESLAEALEPVAPHRVADGLLLPDEYAAGGASANADPSADGPRDDEPANVGTALLPAGRNGSQRATTAVGNTILVGTRNGWQLRQRGGVGEPFYRDPEGFEAGLQHLIATGRQVYADKWGHRGCDLDMMGIRADDAWHLEHDWDREDGSGQDGGGW